ncbi:MAG: DUF4124 domain-containing protein [bacterium]|jgi:hypothetical protein|nr:DUF4124 domain-containing protein [Betaproteobacteria bacterium]
MSPIKAVSAATFSLALLLGASGPVLSQIYSWTDEQGRRQISDRPPEGNVKDLKVKGGRAPGPGPSSTSTSAPVAKGDERKAQTLNEKALDFNKRQLEREENRVKQEKAEAEARERAQRCEQAQGYLRNLQAGGRATRIDPKTGERLFLDDKERERELVEARRSADSWCKPPAAPPPGATQAPTK